MVGRPFPTSLRLRRSGDFQRVYRQRCTVADGHLLVFGCENGLPHARLGLSVSRKVGNAVVRNRWKRRLREAFRLNQDQMPPGMDLVIVPRNPVRDAPSSLAAKAGRAASTAGRHSPPPPEPDFEVLCRSLVQLAQRVARKARRGAS